ncbi:hypothetical protein GGQ03_002355 [Salinibacter ruber]|uniref:hypothetical protein n=1 Tax=Salinibacter ruber TaxID=146919 RepID=UPI0021675F70|nr:hypothetical protein [Salinibacter ruber]MCS4155061.1 hypothetical protein [Salinibacter ruber]
MSDDSSDVRAQRIRSTGEVLKSVTKWGSVVVIAYFGLEAIRALAGETTFANIDVSSELGIQIGLGDMLWGIFFIIVGLWAVLERHWRKSLDIVNS